MKIRYEGISELPQESTHIYVEILHPDIQKEIREHNGLVKNVYLNGSIVYIPRSNGTYHCLSLVTY